MIITDATTYEQQARTVEQRGIVRGFRLMTERYLEDEAARHYPSPLRWLWILALRASLPRPRLLPRLGLIAAPAATVWALQPLGVPLWAALLLVASPLLHVVARHVLQDGWIAAVLMVAVGASLRGDALALAAAAFALLAMREVSPLYWPACAVAWASGPGDWLAFVAALAAASTLWVCGTVCLLRRSALPVLLRALRGHATPYTLTQQRGAPHRLIVDLVLLSPVVMMTAALHPGPHVAVALCVVGVHAFAPVRNVRLVLGADLLVRAGLAALLSAEPWGPGLLIALLIIDAALIWRTRRLYDPVTQHIAVALGMPDQRH